jgi:hypothetical protein
MFKSKNYSKVKYVRILKMSKNEKCLNLKMFESKKYSNFKYVWIKKLNLKNVRMYKLFESKNVRISNMYEYEKIKKLKNVPT